MKMRKITALLLAVLMLCSLLPLAALAEGTSATLTFDDVAKRTEFTTEVQVWQENGITVTNTKAPDGRTNIGDYSNPARFYATTELKIEYAGMKSLIVNCDDSKDYAGALATVLIEQITGITVTQVGAAVHVAFPEAVNAVVVTIGGQVRAYSVTVSTDTLEVPAEPEAPETTDPAADSKLTIEEAIALGASKEHNTYTEGKYYVTGEITEVYNEQYGNMKITDGKGNILTVYGTYSADGSTRYDALEVKPVVGDTVTVYGIIGQYNGTPQIKNGWITEHVAAPEVSGDATITFDDGSKRTEMTADKQVWVENGITVTNEKAASTSDVRDYTNPVRFYAKSSLKVEFPGMTKVIFVCNSEKYASALQESLGTGTVEGTVVTVELAEAADSLFIAELTAQVRVDSITVVAGTSAPEIPEEPEVPENTDPEADTELTVEQAIALGASKDHNTYTAGKYYVTGKVVEVYNETYGNMKIADEAGNILVVYGTYSADGSTRYDAMEVKPAVGDTVKIYGIVGQYNGTPQIKNGWLVEHTTPEGPSETGDFTFIAMASLLALSGAAVVLLKKKEF